MLFGRDLEEALQPIIRFVLFPVLNDASVKKSSFLGSIEHSTTQFNRLEAALLSVWNDAEGLLNVRNMAVLAQ